MVALHFMKRWIKNGLLFGVLPAVLLVVVLYTYPWGKAELEAIKEQMRDEGARMTPEDMGIELDGLRTPQFDDWVKQVDSLKETRQAIEDEFGRREYSDQDRHFRFSPVWANPPVFGNNDPGADWKTLQERYGPVRAEWKKCVDIVHNAFVLYRPNYSDGIDFRVEDLSLRLDWAKISIDLAYLDIQAGNLNEAVNRLQEILALQNKLRGEEYTTLIDALVFITIDGMQWWVVSQLISHPDVTVEQLDRLKQLRMKTPSADDLLVQSLEGERVFFGSLAFQEIRERPIEYIERLFGQVEMVGDLLLDHQPKPSFWEKWLSRLLTTVLTYGYYLPFCVDYDEAHYRNTMWSAEKKFRGYSEGNLIGNEVIDSFESSYRAADSFDFPPVLILSRFSIPALGGAAEKMIYADVQQHLCLVAIEIAKYRLANGSLPSALSELVLPPSITTDPMTGDPFLYQNHGDGTYDLYSRGSNGADDGGVPVLKNASSREKTRIREHKAPDWLWPQPIE